MIAKLRPIFASALLLPAAVLSGCAPQSPEAKAAGELFDPYENTNRSIHEFNRGVDRYAFRPASKGYVAVVPPDMVQVFNNFAINISMPGQAVNLLLQGKPKDSGIALSRFVVNTIFGIGGLGDPASDFNIPYADTDFGETLHVWGAGEGAYVELPFYGPSTARDSVGVVVDFFTNPTISGSTQKSYAAWAIVAHIRIPLIRFSMRAPTATRRPDRSTCRTAGSNWANPARSPKSIRLNLIPRVSKC